ncbi:MAG: nucleotidyltransferase domain-containing protein [Leptospiraceae bacterium]|nr:nucleotidyltransferase domain-containing protein [Leptospiraceae bacterium]
MIQIQIDDPDIENYFQSKESIVTLLQVIAKNEIKIEDLLRDRKILSREAIVETTTTYFKDKPIIRAFLFGSYARQEAGVDSDIDILIELDYSTPIGTLYYRMATELEELFYKKVDLLSSNAVSPSLIDIINKEKVLIYERKN